MTNNIGAKTVELIGVDLNSEWYIIDIKINWLLIIAAFIVVYAIVFVIKRIINKVVTRKVTIDCLEFGLNNVKVTLVCNRDVEMIAYQLWVELTTRKVALPVEENDVIHEIYNSWYTCFDEIRKLIKSVPARSIAEASDLIDITVRILNEGFRPHLTEWQAKYRRWYEEKSGEELNKTPQEIQREYPQYNQLMADMKKVNQNMISFANQLQKIAFRK